MLEATLDMHTAAREPWDAVVIGAGPAGSLAARELARAGNRVLLVERRAFPRRKVCGACVNDQALSVLHRVGLGTLPASLGAIPLSEFQLRVAGRELRFKLPGGIAISRAQFDAALAGTAIAAGGDFLPSVQAKVGIATAEYRQVLLSHLSETAEVHAKVVLVAAGLGNECLPRDGESQAVVSETSRIGAGGVTREYPELYRAGTIFMAVGRHGYVGLVRQEDAALNLAAAFDKRFLAQAGSPGAASASILREARFPEIPSLADAPWQGTVGLTRSVAQLSGERFFLIGDAAGYVEPFTGEGMAWALTAGVAVAPLCQAAIGCWSPQLSRDWANLYRGLVGRRQRTCRLLALALRHPWIVRGTVGVLSLLPGLGSRLVERVNHPATLSNTGEL